MTFATLARLGAVLVAGGTVLVLLDASSASSRATPASYPSCGTYWNKNTPVTSGQRRVNSCIIMAAREARRARAVAVLTTVEGDPIPTYVYARATGDLLVVTDSTRDKFGSGGWDRSRCRTVGAEGGRLGFGGCRSLGTGKPSWLVPIRLRS
jgi:hypothetical protein